MADDPKIDAAAIVRETITQIGLRALAAQPSPAPAPQAAPQPQPPSPPIPTPAGPDGDPVPRAIYEYDQRQMDELIDSLGGMSYDPTNIANQPAYREINRRLMNAMRRDNIHFDLRTARFVRKPR